MTKTTHNAFEIAQRLCDSRMDTVGDEKPKSLVETFWLNELEKCLPDLEAHFVPRLTTFEGDRDE